MQVARALNSYEKVEKGKRNWEERKRGYLYEEGGNCLWVSGALAAGSSQESPR